MRKHLDLILLLLFGISLFSDVFVGIYLFLVCFPLLVAAKFSTLLGIGIIVLASLRILKRHFQSKIKEEG
jgi:predicted ABC-type exoprotein transport system permease subunit